MVARNIDNKYCNIDMKLKFITYKRMLKSLFYSLSNYKYYSHEGKCMVVEALQQNEDVFKYTTELRHKLFVFFSKIFGFKAGLTMMGLIHKSI